MGSSGTVFSFHHIILVRYGEHLPFCNIPPPAFPILVLVQPDKVGGIMLLFLIRSPDTTLLCNARYQGYSTEEVMFSAFKEIIGYWGVKISMIGKYLLHGRPEKDNNVLRLWYTLLI